MQISWLRSFLSVVAHMSFSEAADELFITQSSISKHIQAIEETLNLELLDRRKMRLTLAGDRFYVFAKQIMKQYDSMLQVMKDYSKDYNRQVRIVAIPALALSGISALLSNFWKEHPEVNYHLTEMEMSRAMSALHEAKADIAIVRTNMLDNPQNYNVIPLREDEVVILCSPSHRFAACKDVSLSEVVKERTVFHNYALAEIKLLLKKHDTSLKLLQPSVLSTSTPNLYQYVNNGIGISVVTNELAKLMDPEETLAKVPIKEHPTFQLGLLVRRGELSDTCNDLVEYFNKNLSSSVRNKT
jgi:LysR family transcriptional activator of glutamate synthase operon